MAKLIVTTSEGTTHSVEGETGLSVMRNIRSKGFDELLAACGGECSCATCHVVVDSDHAARLQPASEDENDLLDGLADRMPTSRLSCQILWSETLDGLKVTIVPAE